ncbi:MAG: PEPxxWA-CTERM sorting domain-containing protein [Pseudomonadota bacterium]
MMKTAIMGAAACFAAFTSVSANAATNIELVTNDDDWTVADVLSDGSVGTASPAIENRAATSWVKDDGSNAATGDAKWITPSDKKNVPVGNYVYTTVIELTNLGGYTWNGTYWADNAIVSILVNGTELLAPDRLQGNFKSDTGNPLFDNDVFLSAGEKTISFEVRNANNGGNNPSGLLINSLFTAVPEPATWIMMIFGLAAAGGAMRRQKKANVRIQFA